MKTRTRWTWSVTAGLLALAFAGCYEHTVTIGSGAPMGPVVYDHWESYWLAGLIGHTKVDAEGICPSGDATIVAKQTFLNGLVAALTGGIYTPTTLEIRCRGGRRTHLELSADEVEDVVRDARFLAWVAEDLPDRLADATSAQERLADR